MWNIIKLIQQIYFRYKTKLEEQDEGVDTNDKQHTAHGILL